MKKDIKLELLVIISLMSLILMSFAEINRLEGTNKILRAELLRATLFICYGQVGLEVSK
jgi:hypothetical protein